MAVQKENYRKMAILIRKAQETGNCDFLSRRIGLVYQSMVSKWHLTGKSYNKSIFGVFSSQLPSQTWKSCSKT
jgi:hypothetical protein